MFRKKSKLPIHWSKIEASAPGKFVLIGDFGDLFARNVIAVAIDRRLNVSIKEHKDEGMLRLHLKDFNETWEWPTRLPIFSMTKLVANYADSLVYSEPMLQKIRPLLNEKYQVKVGPNQQETSQESSQSKLHDGTLPAGSTAIPNSPGKNNEKSIIDAIDIKPLDHSRPIACSPSSEDKTQEAARPLYRVLSVSTMDRQTNPREQADMAVLSFLLLYISLGDSFAASIRPSLDIQVSSDIPMCRGLGSSSAYAVAMCTALMKVFRVSAEPTVIMDWTQTVDKIFHGEKSSLHSSVAINGGYVYFQQGKLKSCGDPHQIPLKLMLIDTGIRRDPKLVNSVLMDKLGQKLDAIDTVLNNVNYLTSQAWRRMNDPEFMPSTIDDSLVVGQQSLDLIGMGHQKSFDIFYLARQSHLTVKQSQAGETVFLLYDGFEDYDNVVAFQKSLKRAGFDWLSQSISFDGFKVTATSLDKEDSFPKLQQ